jgi:hypothetical protein
MNAIQWVVLVGLIYKLNSIPTPKGKTDGRIPRGKIDTQFDGILGGRD